MADANEEALATLNERTGRRELLWHYTSWQGAEAILRTREIWMSHLAYLNDESEFRHGLAIIRQFAMASGVDIEDALTIFAADVPNMYVASFSSQFDSLAQWRGYSGASHGIALGFLSNQLKDVAGPALLRRCAYASETDFDAIRPELQSLIQIIQERRGLSPSNKARYIGEPLVSLLSIIKDKTFKDEDETRLCWHARPGPNVPNFMFTRGFHGGGSLMIPHFGARLVVPEEGKRTDDRPFKLKIPLGGLLVGPGLHRRQMLGAAYLLASKHMEAQDLSAFPLIASSAIPFRTW